MKTFKLITSVLMATILSLSIISMSLSIAVNNTVFNPSFIKNMLNATNSYALVYSQIPRLISSFLPNNLSSASILRFIVNNVSQKGLKNQSEIIIDDFYSYLTGSSKSKSINLAPFKNEVESMTSNSIFKDFKKSVTNSNTPILNIPNTLKLDSTPSQRQVANLFWLYNSFRIAPYILGCIIILCTLFLLVVNRSLKTLFSYLSISFLLSGLTLGLIYLNQRSIINSLLPVILNIVFGSEFKMLSFSLHPMILFTLSSILIFLLYWSIVSCSASIFIFLLTRKMNPRGAHLYKLIMKPLAIRNSEAKEQKPEFKQLFEE